MSEDEDDYASDVNRTPYYTQTERKFLDMITIQALKNLLHFLQETNGEMHMYLHNYIHENPFIRGFFDNRYMLISGSMENQLRLIGIE